MVQTREEQNAKQKEYDAKPENKAKKKERDQSPEYRAKDKARRRKPENKAREKARRAIPANKAKDKEYQARPEVRVKHRKHQARPEIKASNKEDRDYLRSQVLQYYSKLHSKSDIPICRCCGENSHLDFLAIDHITGRNEMESDIVLKLLGYSKKLKHSNLYRWIIKNNFPDGFQVLCHNCNTAKAYKRNKQVCPLAGKHQQ